MKKHIGILFFLFSLIISGILIFKPALAEDAALLPNAVQQFFDSNGNPLSSGKVYFYEVGTSTFKDTYTSSAATTINTNPITLNAGGKASTGGIYGIGLYRQLVKDRNGNTIWDAVTAPGGGSTTPTDVGDGNLVGTVLPWSGLQAPNQYVFAYGQEISRTTYPEFFTAVTQQANVICSAASNTLTGISDTSQIPVGSPIELALCVIAGTTVVSKTSSTVTLSNPSSVSINSVATFFPWGNGNGSTTFNVPDFRGYALAGRDNMGGSAAGRLTSTYFNSPGLGAVGGLESHTQTISEMAAHDHSITDPGHAHSATYGTGAFSAGGNAAIVGIAASGFGTGWSTASATTGITTVITGASVPFSIVQPTVTLNYIIKITPDTSTSIATGVYSIGGMSGVISCGTGILCTGNIISFNASTFAAGLTTYVQYNEAGEFEASPNFTFISPDNLTLGASGITGKFDIFGSTSGRIRQTASAIAGTTNITWGNTSGTPAVTASLPLAINSTTGNVDCISCATIPAGGALSATSPITLNSGVIAISGSSLTKIDDTNVTLTLGGSPTIALITPASLTLGWTGQLAVSRGGTGLSSGTSGGWPYFNSSSTMASSGIISANQIVLGGGVGAGPTALTCATSTTVIHGGTPPTCSQIVANDITTNTVTNSNLSQVGASTLKGNPTAATADIQDFTIGSLTQTISPGATDWIPIYDNATGTIKKVNANSIASSSVAGVATLNGLSGALTLDANSGLNIVSSGSTITITPDIATAANFEAGTANKLLDASVVFTSETTTTYGTTTAFDFNTFINTKVTLTGNATLTCSNIKAGQAGTIALIQDGTGTRVITPNSVSGWCSQFKFAGATVPTLTTSASAVDILSYSCRSSTYCAAALSKGYNP